MYSTTFSFHMFKKKKKKKNIHKDHPKHYRIIHARGNALRSFHNVLLTDNSLGPNRQRISHNHTLCIHVHTAFRNKLSEHKIYSNNRLSLLYGRALESLKQILSPSYHLKGIKCKKIRKIIISAVDSLAMTKIITVGVNTFRNVHGMLCDIYTQ